MPRTIEVREAWCGRCHDIVEHSVRAPVHRAGVRPAEVELWICPRTHLRLSRSRVRVDGLG